MTSLSKLVDSVIKGRINEVAPEGWEGTVKAMKKDSDIDNPWALSWWMKKQGYKSHKKENLGKGPGYQEMMARRKELMNELKFLKPGTEEYEQKDKEIRDIDRRRFSPKESRGITEMVSKKVNIRVWHPLYGKGTIQEITESNVEVEWDNLQKRMTVPHILSITEAKQLKKIKEASDDYSDDPKDVSVTKKYKKKKAKKRTDESMVAMGMSAIQNTYRGERLTDSYNLDLTMADLMEEDYEKKENDEEDDVEDKEEKTEVKGAGGIGSNQRKDCYYTNVPHPSDSVLTAQGSQDSDYESEPLSTMGGAENADEEWEERMADDPEDAPSTPEYREPEDGIKGIVDLGVMNAMKDKAHRNDTRRKSSKTEESEMKDSMDLTARDLGLVFENDLDDESDVKETHDTESGEIGLTRELAEKLLTAIVNQAPEQNKVSAIVQGLSDASKEKGVTLDVDDISMVMDKIKSAYHGSPDMEPDAQMVPGQVDAMDMGADESEGDDDDYDYEDKAKGDGERAGAEGGEEHEGKIKMMDDEGHLGESGDSGTPIGQGAKSGPGGGSTTDLSKSKNERPSTSIAAHKSKGKGPGGSSSDEYGQKPSNDGGSNLLPAADSGKQHGAADNPFSKSSPAPMSGKGNVNESRKHKNSKKQLDEAIMLGMSTIPSIGLGSSYEEYEIKEDDPNAELKMIRRRAGLANWWKM
jgi:hypothetical protein